MRWPFGNKKYFLIETGTDPTSRSENGSGKKFDVLGLVMFIFMIGFPIYWWIIKPNMEAKAAAPEASATMPTLTFTLPALTSTQWQATGQPSPTPTLPTSTVTPTSTIQSLWAFATPTTAGQVVTVEVTRNVSVPVTKPVVQTVEVTRLVPGPVQVITATPLPPTITPTPTLFQFEPPMRPPVEAIIITVVQTVEVTRVVEVTPTFTATVTETPTPTSTETLAAPIPVDTETPTPTATAALSQ